MASIAAYSGLRWGELTALTIPQVDTEARTIAVDRKVIEVAGHLYIEAPKNRKLRQTIHPNHAGRLSAGRASSQAASRRPAPSRKPVSTRSG